MFGFTIKAMFQRTMTCVLLIALALFGTLGLLLLSGFLEAQHIALEAAYDNTVINGMICNPRGNMRYSLKIPRQLYELFYSAPLNELVDNVSLYTEAPLYTGKPFVELIDGSDSPSDADAETANNVIAAANIIIAGITKTQAVSELSAMNGVSIAYFDGYDESAFESDKDVCIIPANLLSYAVKREDESYGLTVVTERQYEIEDPVTGEKRFEIERYTKEVTVIGEFSSVSSRYIYMPFKAYDNWLVFEERILEIDRNNIVSGKTDSLEFTVKDNHRISELGKLLLNNFSEPDLHAEGDSGQFSFKILDDIFNESIAKLNQNISLLKTIIPILYVLSSAVGFLTCFLSMRLRKKEFAVQRSLGVKRYLVTLLAFIEQLILALIGGGAGMLCFEVINANGNIKSGLIFLACYMAGALVSAIWITNVNVMKLLKTED